MSDLDSDGGVAGPHHGHHTLLGAGVAQGGLSPVGATVVRHLGRADHVADKVQGLVEGVGRVGAGVQDQSTLIRRRME